MVDIITPIIGYGLGGGLIKAILELMRLRQERRFHEESYSQQMTLAQEERNHQIRLQEMRNEQERYLARIRFQESAPGIAMQVVESNNHSSHQHLIIAGDCRDNYPAYLNVEAELLSERGFDVLLDPVSHGYGLALVIQEDLTLGLWLPPTYPDEAPMVFIVTPTEIEEIHFESDAWHPDRNILEIVDAITAPE